jgi:hypothetical protein
LGQFSRIIELLPKNLSLSSQKYEFGIRDPGSGKNLSRIRKKPIPDPGPGVKKPPDPGTGSATLENSSAIIMAFLGGPEVTRRPEIGQKKKKRRVNP